MGVTVFTPFTRKSMRSNYHSIPYLWDFSCFVQVGLLTFASSYLPCLPDRRMVSGLLRFSYAITAAGPSLTFTGFPFMLIIAPEQDFQEPTNPLGKVCQALFLKPFSQIRPERTYL
jgi:hypothetical protein